MMTSNAAPPLSFPVGYHLLHPDISINFQMNRFYDWVGDERMLAELREAAPRIQTYADLKHEVLALAERALASGRRLTGAYYLRLAEFYVFADDPEKQTIRRRFLDELREAYRIQPSFALPVPCDDYRLRAYRFPSGARRSTLVLFGGFDSYIEEWWPMFLHLQDQGFDVVAFEGPGQGTVIEDEHIPFTPDWGRPVRAILDHFGLGDVTLIGLSLGGGLAILGAADEPRVRRIVAVDILTDFLDVVLRQTAPVVRGTLRALLALRAETVVDALARQAMRRSRVVEWGLKHGMHVMGVDRPSAFLKAASRFQTRDASRRVTQDCLLLAGADDHYVPLTQLYDQMARLTSARSVTARIFTRAESAHNHCQVGNLGLALDVILNWIDQLTLTTAVTGDTPTVVLAAARSGDI